MSEHAHDEHGGHDDPAHGPEPLVGVDAADLHAVVAALAATLHGYVDVAVGVRAEFGSTEADEDPRILALESEVGALNAQLYDLLHERLGLHADLTGMSWGEEEHGDADAPRSDAEIDTFHLGFVVGPPPGTSDLSLESVLDLVEQGGADLAQRLVDVGFEVGEWGASRGAAVTFLEVDDEGEDDDRAEGS
ncbi:hypothetical protein [Cellulomonas fengjieae]|uniref:Uncharacterized protein n=1 Tax=Cellulomonas fengjieae TaxID=2819978 RepID=A0ABS3SKZ8_9CELL|nr:hypothetical protein [Cellulomonas fengjieae]MBO3086398.1 hypothetical protein [Cellulomonas fengjieae]QVI66731.1 hypothetical protein KG102_03805 [Cellulomonas fengjieae]